MGNIYWNDKATFFCGHRKCGTTMLLNLFDAHPEVATFPPDSGFFYAYYPIFDNSIYTKDEKINRAIQVMFQNFKVDLESLDIWTKDSFFPFQDLEELFRTRMKNKETNAKNILSEIVFCYQTIASQLNDKLPKPDKAKRWLEKTTSTEIYAHEVLEWYPKAKFVHILRDPRDNYGSLKSGWEKRYSKYNDSTDRLLQSVLDRGLLGMKMAKINQEKFGKDVYKVIKFEDITTKPEVVLKDICSFLGINYYEILLVPTYFGLPWKGNNFEGKKFNKPSAKNVNRWRQRITEHEAKVIEFYFSQDMETWGYQPFFNRSEQAKAASEHYKWHNFSQAYSVFQKGNTY